MTRRAHYFLGKAFIGSVDGVHDQARSHVILCRGCGDIWARVVVEGAVDCDVWQNACEVHTNQYAYTAGMLPGSIVPSSIALAIEAYGGDPLLLKRLPEKLLVRELRIELAYKGVVL